MSSEPGDEVATPSVFSAAGTVSSNLTGGSLSVLLRASCCCWGCGAGAVSVAVAVAVGSGAAVAVAVAGAAVSSL